jgi:hypothetical protein
MAKGNKEKGGVNLRKQALINEARLKRNVRRNLQRGVGSEQDISEEMVKQAITKKSINKLDAELRFKNHSLQNKPEYGAQPYKKFGFQKPPQQVSYIAQFPYKALKRNVAWLPLQKQDANSTLSLTEEIEQFAEYVKVSHRLRWFTWKYL